MSRKSSVDKYNNSAKGRFRQLTFWAKRRGLELTIDKEQYLHLTEGKKCFYCKSALGSAGHGLDRIDNDKGYHPDNVVPCCDTCNRLKSDLLTHVEMVAVALCLRKLRAGYEQD